MRSFRPLSFALLLACSSAGAGLVGCSSGPGNFGGDDASTEAGDDGGTGDDGATDGAVTKDSGGGTDGGAKDSGVVVDSGDGFGAARTACINEINKLRATEGKPAYALWTGSTIDTCVDEQATYDEQNNSAHDAWISGVYPTCNGNGQDECLGYGLSPAGVVACLDDMWAEKNQPNCAGCAACAGSYNPNCPNCDFYGSQNTPECGHYVNMSALYFTEAACGFSTLNNKGTWCVQNFHQ